MIELIVVIGLILLLTTILVVTLGNALGSARKSATEATLLKLDGMLQQRIEAFRNSLDTPQQQSVLKAQATAMQQNLDQTYSIRGVPAAMLNLLVLKQTMRRAFPQTLADNPALGNAGQPFNGNLSNEAESSEMLYWLITQADSFGVSPVDDSEFSSAELGDTDGDGRREFIDNWGNPLRFYRWPTRLIRPGGAANSINRAVASLLISGLPSVPTQPGDVDPLTQDPDDRIGVYEATVNGTSMTPAQYETLAHTPDTYWVPLIVSAGADKSLGLFEPFDATTTQGQFCQPRVDAMGNVIVDPLTDNLTSKQKQK